VSIRKLGSILPLDGGSCEKIGLHLFPSFRRKPESSIFKPLRIAWTPVFTGVTTKRQFFHSFGEGKGGGDSGDYFTASRGEGVFGWKII
jgi:hypothetical protein